MRQLPAIFIVVAIVSLPRHAPTAQSSSWLDDYREPAARLIAESLSNHFAWERLALLGDTFGHRLSGSKGLEEAIRWAVTEMKKDDLDNVRTDPVRFRTGRWRGEPLRSFPHTVRHW